MKWRLDEKGNYVKDGFLIEHDPKQCEIKPYILYRFTDKAIFVNQYETLDIAKRNAK